MLAFASPLAARTLEVGPGQPYAAPSAAAAVAADGDIVRIAAGEYFDCAVWHASHLTIIGDDGATLTDRACDGKAAFVIAGDDVVLRTLRFARIRVPDGNGAGVRGEGRDLTVEASRFDNDQVGILAGGGGSLRILDCAFTDTSRDAIRADGFDLLRVEGARFATSRGGAHIVAAVARSELVGNDFGPTAGPLLHLRGGALLLADNAFHLDDGERPGAVLATGAMTEIVVRGNTLRGGEGAALLRNWTGTTALAADNHVPPGSEAVSEAGSTWHRLRALLAALRDWLHGVVAQARHLAGAVLRRLA